MSSARPPDKKDSGQQNNVKNDPSSQLKLMRDIKKRDGLHAALKDYLNFLKQYENDKTHEKMVFDVLIEMGDAYKDGVGVHKNEFEAYKFYKRAHKINSYDIRTSMVPRREAMITTIQALKPETEKSIVVNLLHEAYQKNKHLGLQRASDEYKKTPLMYAAECGNPVAIKWILDNKDSKSGKDVNLADDHGSCALEYSVMYEDLDEKNTPTVQAIKKRESLEYLLDESLQIETLTKAFNAALKHNNLYALKIIINSLNANKWKENLPAKELFREKLNLFKMAINQNHKKAMRLLLRPDVMDSIGIGDKSLKNKNYKDEAWYEELLDEVALYKMKILHEIILAASGPIDLSAFEIFRGTIFTRTKYQKNFVVEAYQNKKLTIERAIQISQAFAKKGIGLEIVNELNALIFANTTRSEKEEKTDLKGLGRETLGKLVNRSPPISIVRPALIDEKSGVGIPTAGDGHYVSTDANWKVVHQRQNVVPTSAEILSQQNNVALQAKLALDPLEQFASANNLKKSDKDYDLKKAFRLYQSIVSNHEFSDQYKNIVSESLIELGNAYSEKWYGVEKNKKLAYQHYKRAFRIKPNDERVRAIVEKREAMIRAILLTSQEVDREKVKDELTKAYSLNSELDSASAGDEKGKSPLMYAAESGNVVAAEWILKKLGVNKSSIINFKDDNGYSAIDYAVMYKSNGQDSRDESSIHYRKRSILNLLIKLSKEEWVDQVSYDVNAEKFKHIQPERVARLISLFGIALRYKNVAVADQIFEIINNKEFYSNRDNALVQLGWEHLLFMPALKYNNRSVIEYLVSKNKVMSVSRPFYFQYKKLVLHNILTGKMVDDVIGLLDHLAILHLMIPDNDIYSEKLILNMFHSQSLIMDRVSLVQRITAARGFLSRLNQIMKKIILGDTLRIVGNEKLGFEEVIQRLQQGVIDAENFADQLIAYMTKESLVKNRYIERTLQLCRILSKSEHSMAITSLIKKVMTAESMSVLMMNSIRYSDSGLELKDDKAPAIQRKRLDWVLDFSGEEWNKAINERLDGKAKIILNIFSEIIKYHNLYALQKIIEYLKSDRAYTKIEAKKNILWKLYIESIKHNSYEVFERLSNPDILDILKIAPKQVNLKKYKSSPAYHRLVGDVKKFKTQLFEEVILIDEKINIKKMTAFAGTVFNDVFYDKTLISRLSENKNVKIDRVIQVYNDFLRLDTKKIGMPDDMREQLKHDLRKLIMSNALAIFADEKTNYNEIVKPINELIVDPNELVVRINDLIAKRSDSRLEIVRKVFVLCEELVKSGNSAASDIVQAKLWIREQYNKLSESGVEKLLQSEEPDPVESLVPVVPTLLMVPPSAPPLEAGQNIVISSQLVSDVKNSVQEPVTEVLESTVKIEEMKITATQILQAPVLPASITTSDPIQDWKDMLYKTLESPINENVKVRDEIRKLVAAELAAISVNEPAKRSVINDIFMEFNRILEQVKVSTPKKI